LSHNHLNNANESSQILSLSDKQQEAN
jgi:hypothetical protein